MSIWGSGIRHVIPPALQADLADNCAPVSGTEYPVLAATQNVVIYSASVKCTWTVQPTPLELHFTIDGNAITHSVANPDSNTWYDLMFTASVAETLQGLSKDTWNITDRSPYAYMNRSIAITAEITGGTVQDLAWRVKWGRW